MPLEIDLPDDQEQISLADYVDHLAQGRFDLSEQEDLIASAPLLKKLANNKDFLLDKVFAELQHCLQFQQSNIYAPEVLLLHTTDDYFIRANIWKPITKVEEQIPGYRYDVCHDHNFDILTVGYLGPGYCSRAYRYDQSACVGMLGEAVELQPQPDFTLREGAVALYRAKLDVHIQMAPERLSVSINLIPKSEARHALQLQFDEASRTVSRYLNFSGAEVAIRLAGLLGESDCMDILSRLSTQHPNAKVRALAIVSQLQIEPSEADRIRDDLNAHPPLVRHIVDAESANYGACMRTIQQSAPK